MGVTILDVIPCLHSTAVSLVAGGDVAFEGLLRYESKQGEWKERWFVLDGSQYRLIKCSTSSRQPSQSLRSVVGGSDGVRIADVQALSKHDGGDTEPRTGLDIVTISGRRIRFLTSTQRDEELWCNALRKASHGLALGVAERLAHRELLAEKYALVRELGRGASGVVSLYTYQGMPFAIKKFVPQKSKQAPNRLAIPAARMRQPVGDSQVREIPEEVRREIALLRKASHLPYVIKLHDVIVDEEAQQYYLVMEYMGGGAIAEWDPERKCYVSAKSTKSLSLLDEKTVRTYMTNLLLGIQALHQNGLCHRDIKPENIMANDEKTMCKIGDLGVAHYFRHDANGDLTEELNPDQIELGDVSSSSHEDVERTRNIEPARRELSKKAMLKTTKGTYQFLSPEAVSGDEFDGFKADIWAIGVTFYALLFGYLPFFSTDAVKLFERIENDAVVIPDTCVDRDVKDLLLKMLEKDPEKRISIESILEHPWLHRSVDSNSLTSQVRALKRSPRLQVEAHELNDAVSVLHNRFDQLSKAVKNDTLKNLRDQATNDEEPLHQSESDRNAAFSSYRPQPIPLEGISLPLWMVEDMSCLAEQLHFDWCRAKHHDGWVHGAVRDDNARVHPLLVPMRQLSEGDRARNFQCVEETLKCIVALGCHVTRSGGTNRRGTRSRSASSPPSGLLPFDQVTLSWDMLMLIDLLAENSHEVWAAGYVQQGWSWGSAYDEQAKTHPSLKPYMKLEETEKSQCRDGVSTVLRSCLCLGYDIRCSRERSKSM